MDRRGFLIATGTALAALTGDWAQATARAAPLTATGGRRRLTAPMVAHLEQRLDHLRRLDDSLGGRDLLRVAADEFELIGTLASGTVYDTATGRRLFSALSEAGRICGWLQFDQGYQATAQKYYLTALRASATAGDPETGANVLAFMAIQAYSAGDPRDAVALGQAAQEQVTRRTTLRVRAILHARTARSLSKTPGGKAGCARELTAARDAVASAPSDDDPAWSYWVTPAEIEMLAGSCALDVGAPARRYAALTPPTTPTTTPTATSATTPSFSPGPQKPTSPSATSPRHAAWPARRSPRTPTSSPPDQQAPSPASGGNSSPISRSRKPATSSNCPGRNALTDAAPAVFRERWNCRFGLLMNRSHLR